MPRFALVLAATATLVLSACGSSGSGTAPTPVPTPVTTLTATASASGSPTASHDRSSVQLRPVISVRHTPCGGIPRAVQPVATTTAVLCDPVTATTYRLAKAGLVGGVVDAEASIPPNQVAWSVTVTLDARSSGQLARLTSALAGTGQQLAVVVGGRVVSAPVVELPITGGRLTITGNLTRASARSLAADLRR